MEFILEEFFELFKHQPPKYNLTSSFQFYRKLLNKRNNGFNLTGKLRLSRENSYRGAMVIGGSGSGKSRRVLIPSIKTLDANIIVHDPSGELLDATNHNLQKRGYVIKVFNPSRPEVSDGFNFLSELTPRSNFYKLADSIVRTAIRNDDSDGFWEVSATSLISMAIEALSTTSTKYRTLPNLRHFLMSLQSDPKALELFMKSVDRHSLFEQYLTFIGYEEKLRSGIIATALATLSFMNSKAIQDICSKDTLKLEGIRKGRFALFIQTNTADVEHFHVLNSLLFETLFANVMSKLPDENDRDVFFLLDEAASLSCPSLPIASANIRKYRSGLLLALQDFAQLEGKYGIKDASAIRANSYAKLLFGGGTHQTTVEFSDILGSYEYEDKYNVVRKRQLMTPDELRTLSSKKALLVAGNELPVIAPLARIGYVRNRRFNGDMNRMPLKVELMDFNQFHRATT